MEIDSSNIDIGVYPASSSDNWYHGAAIGNRGQRIYANIIAPDVATAELLYQGAAIQHGWHGLGTIEKIGTYKNWKDAGESEG